MAGSNFPVDVNPAVLRWARESAGYTVEEAGNRVADPQTLQAWESGKDQPSWAAIKRLAKLCKRPVAALLLSQPPAEPPLPPDFRRLPEASNQLSPKTRLAIRTARWLAATAVELERELDRAAQFRSPKARFVELCRATGRTVSQLARRFARRANSMAKIWRGLPTVHQLFLFEGWQFDE